METQTKQIDLHQLDLRYDHTRIYKKKVLNKLCRSLEQFGQINPVVVIQGEGNQFILVDGYLRVKAIRMCGMDQVMGVVHKSDEKYAVLSMLKKNDGRSWEVFEEASLLNEFILRFKLGISETAELIGHDKSFVKRRLDLVRELPEEILAAVSTGAVSMWSATRILVPLARANSNHALNLTAHLKKNSMSTRDMQYFFKIYKKANHNVRSRMIDDPPLFLKAVQSKHQEHRALTLAGGIEGRWLKDIVSVCAVLKDLNQSHERAIYPGQETGMRKKLVDALHEAYTLFNHLHKEVMCHDQTGNARCNQGDASTQYSYSNNCRHS
ncbi:MAG: ParB N-terminal domain-containing protein [Desulfobacula sp.]|jgi:ParB family chromosome partitioning protein|nr:ParB N-terminal domain-containing protein [Desulfobacula sp.]